MRLPYYSICQAILYLQRIIPLIEAVIYEPGDDFYGNEEGIYGVEQSNDEPALFIDYKGVVHICLKAVG